MFFLYQALNTLGSDSIKNAASLITCALTTSNKLSNASSVSFIHSFAFSSDGADAANTAAQIAPLYQFSFDKSFVFWGDR